jgi:hypothetical protein
MNLNRKIEKWAEIIRRAQIDLNKQNNFITSKQIKQLSGEEPRLMAKMDSQHDIPQIFKDYNITIMSVSRSQYVLVKGKSHHTLEELNKIPLIHYSSFPIISNATQSESYYLGYAYACGIIDKLSNYDDKFYPNPRGRHTTKKFDFYLNGNEIRVNKAQIEVDGQYENEKEVIMIEAKLRTIESFNIRQLYYPYRDYVGKKKVRLFFFTVDTINLIFKFWEYVFAQADQFESIKLVNFYNFKVKIKKKIQNLTNIKSITEKISIPQANDLEKVFLLVEKVELGYNDSSKIAEVFKFKPRQSNYYRQAAELLGIIGFQEGKYHVTYVGKEYLNLDASNRKYFICKLILKLPIIHNIFTTLISNPAMEFNRDDVVELIKTKSSLTGDTPKRRTGTIFSWCRWIENNFGYLKVIDNKIVSQILIQNLRKETHMDSIVERIKCREDLTLEYKSSFRFDIKLKQPNLKVLEKIISKTISAFANAQGGTLFIGVDDEGNIVGLDSDYDTLKKKNSDGFELELRSSLEKYTRSKVANESIILKFHQVEEKEICEVKIFPSSRPIFIYDEGGKEERFVRVGNSSKPYTSDEFYDYCARRFR